jgi:hypothetical protein
MAIPVITAPISPRIIAAGVAFSQTLSASNTPTSWAASGLPSGLTIDTETGTISGTPLSQVESTATITATNGEGTSAGVVIIFVVMATPPGMGGPFDIVLDYELTTNEITVPGVERADGSPLFYAPRGTNRFLLVGVKYYGVLQDLNAADEPIAIKLGMKEVEPESLLEVTTSATTKVAGVTDDQQRYRIPFRVTPSNWGVLGDYEADAATIISALAELQVSVGTVASLHDATLTDSSIALQGNVTTPITGDHDFLSIDEFAVATPMRLTLTLSVASRPLQTVTLVREFDLIFSGGAFVISNLTGATTGTGAVEGDQWRATLNLTALTGDANSVDADYSITTNADAVVPYDYYLLGDWSGDDSSVMTTRTLQLYDGPIETPTTLGSAITVGSGLTAAEMAASIEASWEAESGSADVIAVTYTESPIEFKVEVSGSPVTGIEWKDTIVGSDLTAPIPASLIGTATTCSVAATLEQLEDPTAVPLNLTSNQFRIGVARDLVPD